MSYTQTITIAKGTAVDTIGKALALVNTSNPVIYIKKGEYDINAMYLMSKSGSKITWIGEGLDTTVYIHNPAECCNFADEVHFIKIKFECANDIPPYWSNIYVMTYWTDSTKAVFENCLFNISKDGLKPNQNFFFFNNSYAAHFSNKIFINCTFNAKDIRSVGSIGYATFINCLYNTNELITSTNGESTIANTLKDDIDQETYKPVNLKYNSVGIYGGEYAINKQVPSEKIKSSVKDTILNHKMFEYITRRED